jgi:hypothetical protein
MDTLRTLTALVSVDPISIDVILHWSDDVACGIGDIERLGVGHRR